MKSWRTTITGGLTILVAIGAATLQFLNTGALPPLEPVFTTVALGIGLLFARDNKVTSESAGAK